MSQVDILPVDEETNSLSTSELIAYLNDESFFLRARVIVGLGKRLRESSEAFHALLLATQDPKNRYTPFFGFIMVSWLGVITIMENGNVEQKAILKGVLKEWSSQEREDLQAYLADTDFPLAEVF